MVPGRDVAQNARMFAAVAQAMDDAMIGVFDAKYHYNFWRPATAIRNGDIDGNEATQREASWSSFVDAPMHPEYPSAHSILGAAVGAVLKAEIGKGPMPALTTTSPTAKGAARRWTNLDDFTREVGRFAHLRRHSLQNLDRCRHRDGQADRRVDGTEVRSSVALVSETAGRLLELCSIGHSESGLSDELRVVHGQDVLVRNMQPVDALAVPDGARLLDAVPAVQSRRRFAWRF